MVSLAVSGNKAYAKENGVVVKKILSAAVLCSLVLLSACSPKPAEDPSTGGAQVLEFGNAAEPESLDPHLMTGVSEHRIASALFEGLVDCDHHTLEPVPAVAESWTISDDAKVYTFKLRPNARWSNGDPVTAHDFIYSWRRNLTPALGSEYAYMLHCIENARAFNEGVITSFDKVGAKAIDDTTLELRLEAPTPYLLPMQAHSSWYPVHRATLEKFGAMTDRGSKWTRAGNLVGNGAFTLTRWEPNRIISVAKNVHYWNAAKVKLNTVNFHPIDDGQAEERLFRKGKLHVANAVPLSKIPTYRREEPGKIHIDPYLATYFYRFNTRRPPFDDTRVRLAFSMCIDRQMLVDMLKGDQRPAYFLTPPDTAGYTCRSNTIRHDVEEAKRLLAEAGYPEGKGLPSMELLYNTSENHKIIAEALQQMWKKNLGAHVSLINQDWKVYLATQKAQDYDMCRASWVGDVVDPINFLECFTTGSGNNRTGFSSKAFDGLIARSRPEVNEAKRFELLQDAERILMENQPILPIYFYTHIYLLAPQVKGWGANQRGYVSFKDLWLETGTA